MSGMNFFSWLRDGVRQSVLLGVSDAVEQLGAPPNNEDLNPTVAGFLKLDRSSEKVAQLGTSNSRKPPSKKRLGKSLKDIGAEKTK